MPTRRSAAAKSPSKSPSKAEAPSKRKGAPRKVEVTPPPEDVKDEDADTTPVRRGKSRAAKKAAAVAVEEVRIHEIDTAEPITINMEDLIDMPSPAAAPVSTSKKRRAPAKSQASKKGKTDTASPSKLDMGGAGDGENLIQCTLCDAKVVQLVRHIRAQHGDDPDYEAKIKEARALEAKVQSTSSPRKGASNLLDDITTSISKMEKVATTTRAPRESSGSLIRPKNTQCPICEKVVRRYDLNKHIRNVHSGEKPNKCPYCDYASPWKGNLNTHIAGVHTKARLHDCIRCGLSFKTRSAMIGHVRKVHDKMYQPKERLFECEECMKKFYKKFHLQRHIRVHTGEKPFVCAFCEKCFASKTNMDSHIQSVHLKIKPFKCGYCDKGFARKKMMLVHIRKYHMNKDDTEMAISLNDVDDITLDDNIDEDNASDTGSVESGEILAGEDGDEQNMVLIKMRDDEAEGDTTDAVKSYMFVPAENLPSDLDTTAEQSMLGSQSSSAAPTPAKSKSIAAAKKTPSATVVMSETAEQETVTATTTQPMVINVPAGQVVQAVQTSEGIMLLTSDPKSSSSVRSDQPAAGGPVTQVLTASVRDTTDQPTTNTDKPQAQPLVEAPAAQPAPAAEPSTAIEPDLVQQALAETLPEVSAAITTESTTPAPEPQAAVTAAVGKGLVTSDTGDLTTSLPANLLATEEAEQADTANGEVTEADFEFLSDMQTNGTN